MAALLFVSKRLQPVALALLLLSAAQLTAAAAAPAPWPQGPERAVVVAVSPGSP
jgi:hypothetical protein